jgi:phage terminase large subunit-like protein
MIWAADPAADWKDEKTWAAATPNLGVSIKLDFLRSECQRAIEMPAYENTFKQLYLNCWTEQDKRWLQMSHWAQGNKPCPVDLTGRECFAGLDLATTFDTTAFVLLFPLDDGTFWVEPHFFVPEENMHQRVRRDKVPYDLWARKGSMHVTQGNVTDYAAVRAKILELAKKYTIRQIAVDRWNSSHLVQLLQEDGLPVLGFGQGYGSMSAPALQVQAWVVGGKLLHGGNEPLTWQAGNVAIQTDGQNIKPSKQRSPERIDGIVALTMAAGVYATSATQSTNWDIITL